MRPKGSLWQKVALYLGFACLLVAALRRPSEAARPSTERPDAPNPPAPRPHDNEKGSILARSVGLLFVATMVFALGAALGGAFAASADDGASDRGWQHEHGDRRSDDRLGHDDRAGYERRDGDVSAA